MGGVETVRYGSTSPAVDQSPSATHESPVFRFPAWPRALEIAENYSQFTAEEERLAAKGWFGRPPLPSIAAVLQQHTVTVADNKGMSWPRVPGSVPTEAGRAQVLETAAVKQDSAGVVMPLYANTGFLPFLRNLLCSLSRIGTVRNHFIIALDNSTCGTLQIPFGLANSVSCVHPYAGFGAASHNQSSSGVAAGYRSTSFSAIMLHRVAWNLRLLEHGYNVMHCDLDIVWLHDPMPVLQSPRHLKNDLLIQSEQVYGYNGGFYLARARASTIAGVKWWMADLVHTWETNPKKFEEQHALVNMIKGGRKHRHGLNMTSAKLNQSEFPNGKIWLYYPKTTSKTTAYIVHMNWLVGGAKKKHRLARDGLWFLTDDDARCDTSFDPHEGGCNRWCTPVNKCSPGRACDYIPSCSSFRVGNGSTWHQIAKDRCHRRNTVAAV